MKIKKADIKKIIQEEISKLMVEVELDPTRPAKVDPNATAEYTRPIGARPDPYQLKLDLRKYISHEIDGWRQSAETIADLKDVNRQILAGLAKDGVVPPRGLDVFNTIEGERWLNNAVFSQVKRNIMNTEPGWMKNFASPEHEAHWREVNRKKAAKIAADQKSRSNLARAGARAGSAIRGFDRFVGLPLLGVEVVDHVLGTFGMPGAKERLAARQADVTIDDEGHPVFRDTLPGMSLGWEGQKLKDEWEAMQPHKDKFDKKMADQDLESKEMRRHPIVRGIENRRFVPEPAPEFLKKDQTHAHVPEPVKDFRQRAMTRRRKALMPKDKYGRPAPRYDRAGEPYRPRNLSGTASLGENKLKFTRSQLNNIINKEIDKVLEEMKRTRRFRPTTKMSQTPAHHSDPDCQDPLGRPMSIDSYGPGMTSAGEKCAKAELEIHFGATIEGMGVTKDSDEYRSVIDQLLEMVKDRDLDTMALKMSLSPNRHSISRDRLGNVIKSVDRGFPDEEKRTIVQSILSNVQQQSPSASLTETTLKKAIAEHISTLLSELNFEPMEIKEEDLPRVQGVPDRKAYKSRQAFRKAVFDKAPDLKTSIRNALEAAGVIGSLKNKSNKSNKGVGVPSIPSQNRAYQMLRAAVEKARNKQGRR